MTRPSASNAHTMERTMRILLEAKDAHDAQSTDFRLCRRVARLPKTASESRRQITQKKRSVLRNQTELSRSAGVGKPTFRSGYGDAHYPVSSPVPRASRC